MKKIAVIGAGVSGLSTAHFLKEKGHEVTIYEKEEKPGGLIRCQRVNGSLFHICGGHVFNSKRQDVLNWFWSKFNREEEFSKADRNSVVFMEDGREIPYPIENHMYLFGNEIQKRFIDDLVLMTKMGKANPENFEDFLRGKFGKTLYELYFQPYNEKVWRRDLRHVPLTWLEGKLPMPSVEEIIFNNFNHVKEKAFVHSTFWYERNGGSQFIAEKLADGLDVRYNSEISQLELAESGWLVAGEYYDNVVFCGNIKDMVNIIVGVDVDQFKQHIEALEYHGTTAVFCEIDKNPYSWIYQPSRKHESHRIICTGNFSPTNNNQSTPENRITATIEFTDEISYEGILDNLTRIPLHPTYIAHHFSKYTYPIQNSQTRNVIRNLKSVLAPYGFFFTGRFADWEYYNMDVSMGAAMDTVKGI